MAKNPRKKVILVVDDTPEILDLIKIGLTPEHTVKAAVSGEIALKIAAQQTPDLILLDVMMPGMDGYEACRLLREMPALQDVPVIFVTAMSEVEDEVKGLALGAVDYLTKPISLPILQARVHTHLALKSAREEIQEKNRLLEEERELVEEVVVRMRTDHNFDPRHLRTLLAPVEATCGDLILSAFRPDGGQHLLVGDFTGHGLPAAIGGPLVSHLFYSMTGEGQTATEILCRINEIIYRQLPTRQFLAGALVEINPARDQLTLWNAALPDGLLVRGDGSTRRLASNLMPLGIVGDMAPGEGEGVSLTSADRLYLFSDGLMEAVNDEGAMFGYPRLESQLIRCASDGQPLEAVLEEVNAFRGSKKQMDDFTLAELSP